MRPWPPPYRYGLSPREFAAQMACLTSSGASVGAAAEPSSSSLATVPGTSSPVHSPGNAGVAGGVGVVAGVVGGTGGGTYDDPPVSGTVSAAAGAARTHSIVITRGPRARGYSAIALFRRPAGLADGLALKEP